MRLDLIVNELKDRKIHYELMEEDDCISIDFIWRGLSYHIWEFVDDDGSRGCETNVFSTGRTVELGEDYKEVILKELKNWPYME